MGGTDRLITRIPARFSTPEPFEPIDEQMITPRQIDAPEPTIDQLSYVEYQPVSRPSPSPISRAGLDKAELYETEDHFGISR